MLFQHRQYIQKTTVQRVLLDKVKMYRPLSSFNFPTTALPMVDHLTLKTYKTENEIYIIRLIKLKTIQLIPVLPRRLRQPRRSADVGCENPEQDKRSGNPLHQDNPGQ